MRELTFTHYASAKDTHGRPETKSWEDWVQVFSTHTVKGAPEDSANEEVLNTRKGGACVVLGAIPAGQSHKNSAVTEVHAMGLDIDAIDEAGLEKVVDALKLYEWVVYTTHKHGSIVAAGAMKVRIILPLSEALPRTQHKAAWLALQRLVGGVNDEQTKNVARVFYLPTTFDASVAWAHRNEGEWLNAKTLISNLGPLKERELSSLGASELARLLDTSRPGGRLQEMARAVVNGQTFAEPGKRHAAILELTMWLAKKSRHQPFTDEALAEVFEPSLEAFRARDGEGPNSAEISQAYQGALTKKVEEAFERQAHGLDRYTDEDLERIAKVAGVPYEPGAVAQALQHRWIIHASDQTYYILAHDGGYRGPFGAAIGRTAAVELLARSPVLLNEPSEYSMRRRPLQELAEDFGSAASSTVVDLTADITHYDEQRRVVHEAARPLRKHLVPVYNEGIDRWLRVFAGPDYEKLCDWLACAPDLSKMLCALYLSGGPAAGKTIFAMGVSQLWADSPANFNEAFGSSFNEELLRCPLVLADEDFGQAKWKKTDVTGQIRSMISTLDRTVTRKYMAPTAMRGAVRLVIAANNDYLLSSRETLSGQDLEAIAQRFLYIRAPENSAEHMAAIPGEVKEGWKRNGIAQHALWLQTNRSVERGRRFWVEGDVTQMHRLMTITSDWTSRACEWLVRFLMNPKPYANRRDGLVRAGSGKLLVNEQAIIDGWTIYFGERTRIEPETAKIGAALRAIAKPERPCLRWGGKRLRYRDVVVDTLFAWSEAHGIGDKDEMLRTLWDGEAPREPGVDTDDADKTTDDLSSIPAVNSGEEFV
jgi:hypothetical protein